MTTRQPVLPRAPSETCQGRKAEPLALRSECRQLRPCRVVQARLPRAAAHLILQRRFRGTGDMDGAVSLRPRGNSLFWSLASSCRLTLSTGRHSLCVRIGWRERQGERCWRTTTADLLTWCRLLPDAFTHRAPTTYHADVAKANQRPPIIPACNQCKRLPPVDGCASSLL